MISKKKEKAGLVNASKPNHCFYCAVASAQDFEPLNCQARIKNQRRRRDQSPDDDQNPSSRKTVKIEEEEQSPLKDMFLDDNKERPFADEMKNGLFHNLEYAVTTSDSELLSTILFDDEENREQTEEMFWSDPLVMIRFLQPAIDNRFDKGVDLLLRKGVLLSHEDMLNNTSMDQKEREEMRRGMRHLLIFKIIKNKKISDRTRSSLIRAFPLDFNFTFWDDIDKGSTFVTPLISAMMYAKSDVVQELLTYTNVDPNDSILQKVNSISFLCMAKSLNIVEKKTKLRLLLNHPSTIPYTIEGKHVLQYFPRLYIEGDDIPISLGNCVDVETLELISEDKRVNGAVIKMIISMGRNVYWKKRTNTQLLPYMKKWEDVDEIIEKNERLTLLTSQKIQELQTLREDVDYWERKAKYFEKIVQFTSAQLKEEEEDKGKSYVEVEDRLEKFGANVRNRFNSLDRTTRDNLTADIDLYLSGGMRRHSADDHLKPLSEEDEDEESYMPASHVY